MQVVVISDNHGNQDILKIIRHIYTSLYQEQVLFIHLGDSQAQSIQDLNGYICVKGNNDSHLELPLRQRMIIERKKIHFSHGDEGLEQIKKDIDLHHPDLYLYGHTHLVSNTVYKDCLILNPGSITLPRDEWHGSYLILKIHDTITYKVVRLNIESFLKQYQCFL